MIRKSMKRAMSLLLAASMAFALAGCGSGGADDVAGIGSANGDEGADTGDKTQKEDAGEGAQAAMGRYVEDEIDLSEELFEPMCMCMRDDGNLVIADRSRGFFVSTDQGATWNLETPDWLKQMLEDTYIGELCMAGDGTAAVVYDPATDDGDYLPVLKLVLPDGTQVPVEMELTEDEKYVTQVAAGDDGSFFVNTFRSIFEVKQDGSSKKVITPDDKASWIWVKDNFLIMDNDWEESDMPLIYDLGTGEYIEDEVLSDFVAESYSDRYYNGTIYCSMYLLPGADETVYVAGKNGIHRHVVGGNMMEQIVDGSLSLLSNPAYSITSMLQLGEDEFLVLFANKKLIRFTYNPDVPAVPENMLTVYSLRENDAMRQAVSLFQSQNPDTFVSYQIGMGEGDSVTREDALKKLNTELMAGEGPDLLVMDDLPLSSYVAKGMLLDLTDYLAQYSAQEPLFDNVIEALKIGGKAYMAPATFSVPFVAVGEAYTNNMTDLSGLGEAVEKLREENPVKDIIGICTAQGVLKRFVGTSAPKWVSADGVVDREVIGEYLQQCKRIYDAQMDGLDQKVIDDYNELNERYISYAGMRYDQVDMDIYMDLFAYIGGSRKLICGWAGSAYSYEDVLSLERTKGFEDTRLLPMQGQCSKVFKPETLLGINATSGQTEAAKRFMGTFLSADVQGEYGGLPVNKAAYDKQFTPITEYLGENGEYSYLSSSYEDGTYLEYIIYWPNDGQIAAFKEQLGSVNTAYIPDTVLEDAVFKQGAGYMKGEQTLEQALSEIEKNVAIYMAE